MSKYYLVANYYNLRTNRYEKETIIDSIQGEKLSTLSEIDSFTSKYTTTELLNLIDKEKDNQGLNHLAIMYLKNKNATPIYYRIIDNNKEFNECLNMSQTTTNYILGKSKKTIYMNRNNELYRKELNKLLEIINTRNYELFKQIYPYDNDFSFLAKRYLGSSYDTLDSANEDYCEILVEFSRYKTFRGWYVNQLKLKDNIHTKKNTTKPVQPVITPKITATSIEEHIKNYEKKFEDEKGTTYSEFKTNKYNIDNEEFLSEEEYMSMQDDEDDIKRLKRRH